MFKLNPAPTFTATVRLTVPGQEAAGEVAFEFRHKNKEQIAALMQTTDRADRDLIADLVAGWSGVGGEDGEVAYTPAALAQLLENYPAAAREIYAAYLKAMTESRAKN